MIRLETAKNHAPETQYADKPVTSQVIGSTAGIDGSIWKLELYDFSHFEHIREPLNELVKNSISPNPFFDAPFLEPAIIHLGKGQIQLLCLTETSGQHSELKVFAPVFTRKAGLSRHDILQIWSHPYAPLGTPLVNKQDFEQTVERLADCIEMAPPSIAKALNIPDFPKCSPLASALFVKPRLSRLIFRHSVVFRAAITGRNGLKLATEDASGKRKQRIRKAHERLAKFGRLEFVSIDDEASASKALHDHLELEFNCWKGKRGSSILDDEKTAVFVKTAIVELIANGNCTIHALNLNGYPIASMILLHRDNHYFPWKIAYDETYSKYSAGNLLTFHVNELLAGKPGFGALDSLANDLNMTAKRFWPNLLEVSGMIIGIGPDGSKTAMQLASQLDYMSRVKRTIKKWLGRSL